MSDFVLRFDIENDVFFYSLTQGIQEVLQQASADLPFVEEQLTQGGIKVRDMNGNTIGNMWIEVDTRP